MEIDIGIGDKKRTKIAEGVKTVLASSYTLYVKTHNFHWNVTGPHFRTFHVMFEEQYTELAPALDLLAERVRSLGHYAPGSFKQFEALSVIKGTDKIPDAMKMVDILRKDHEALIRAARPVLEIASEAGDDSTADLITERLRLHEKTAWMLRSILEKP